MNTISFMSANYVARQTGYDMHGWGEGDTTTNEYFRPPDTYAERFEEIVRDVSALGFHALDLWGGHLHPSWATDEQIETARTLLERHGLQVASLAMWVSSLDELRRACDIADALGTNVIGGGISLDRDDVGELLRKRGLRLGIENHPEKTPAEVLEKAGDEEALGATVDTGWWATHGYEPARAIEDLRDRLFHVHLKDILRPGEHDTCPWGRGVVDIEACVRALQRIGYTGALSVEHEPEHEDPGADCRSMRIQLEEWLR
jgi:sugar phosphate isomerase/epimerase